MRKAKAQGFSRNRIIPNERRRQTWRKHRLSLTDRRSKWFYQQTFIRLNEDEQMDKAGQLDESEQAGKTKE